MVVKIFYSENLAGCLGRLYVGAQVHVNFVALLACHHMNLHGYWVLPAPDGARETKTLILYSVDH
jgi:hypothetical protein